MATEKKPARSTGKKSAAKKAEEKNIEEEKKKFQQKLIALKELAKSKKNVLELGEINNFLADVQLDEEKTEKVIDLLEASGVDVLRISDDKDVPTMMHLSLNLRRAAKCLTRTRLKISTSRCLTE